VEYEKKSHWRDSDFRKIGDFAHLETFGQGSLHVSRPKGSDPRVYSFHETDPMEKERILLDVK
jgi:hypothetical protein